MHQWYQTLYCPTNAHNVKKNVELLKHFKIKGAAPTCFGLQWNHHQGVTVIVEITHLVQCGYINLVQDVVSVMAAYYDLWGVCAVHSTGHSLQSVPDQVQRSLLPSFKWCFLPILKVTGSKRWSVITSSAYVNAWS